MCAVALRQSRWGVSRVHGAVKAAIPGYIEPCDPTLRENPPRGEDWVYEIKADGYRAQLHLRDADAKVYSRTGVDWTEQFSSIAASADLLKANSAIIDGEAVVYGSGGLPDFQQLRRELGPKRSERVRYHAFDLLYLDGYYLRGVAYEDRKRLLQRLLKNAPESFIYVEALAADGNVIFDKGCKLGLEGLVAKRLGDPYRSGRQESWVKLKCKKSETFPIVAFVEKLGARPRKVASLYVGRRQNGKLLYAGKVRTGYSETTARELRERLDPFIRKTSPLDMAVKKPKATWVEPTLEVEVQYGALTDDGLLREAVLKGFRDDLALRKVKAPRLVPSVAGRPKLGVPRENILQLLPEAVAPSKEELADYWTKAWKKALPHLGHRPLKLVRHVHGTTFYHKGPLPKDIPAAVHPAAYSEARWRPRNAPVGRQPGWFPWAGRSRGHRAAPVECDRRGLRTCRPHRDRPRSRRRRRLGCSRGDRARSAHADEARGVRDLAQAHRRQRHSPDGATGSTGAAR
ncbi:DNA ligase D [Bradyrhizobium sp. GM22.5]